MSISVLGCGDETGVQIRIFFIANHSWFRLTIWHLYVEQVIGNILLTCFCLFLVLVCKWRDEAPSIASDVVHAGVLICGPDDPLPATLIDFSWLSNELRSFTLTVMDLKAWIRKHKLNVVHRIREVADDKGTEAFENATRLIVGVDWLHLVRPIILLEVSPAFHLILPVFACE